MFIHFTEFYLFHTAPHKNSSKITAFRTAPSSAALVKIQFLNFFSLEAQARNNVGWSKMARSTCTTLQLPPDPPQLSLVQATANTLKLKWIPAGSGANDAVELLYFYLEKETENGKFALIYEGENHSTKIKGLRESTSHRFRVRASRVRATPSLAGQWSAPFYVQTTRPPPIGIRSAPTVSEIQPGLLQIEWQSYNKNGRDSSGGDGSTLKSTCYKLQVCHCLSKNLYKMRS